MIKIPYYETSNFVFSNFSPHAIEYKGIIYPTVEHAFHAQKFPDNDLIRSKIETAGSPLIAHSLAKQYKPERRGDWNDIKVGILEELLREKVRQHGDVREALLASGEEEIVEMNPNDEFWGSGKDGSGNNQMGKLLMKIREELHS